MKNVLGPLVYVSPNERYSTSDAKGKQKYVALTINNEYEPQHVCELCHRIYKLYGNKKTMLLSCNASLTTTLFGLAQKPLENWTPGDVKYILEVYAHTLPTIKAASTQGSRKKTGLRHRNYFYGYQSIVELPVHEAESDTLSRITSNINLNKQDYVKLNIRSSSHPYKKKSIIP